MKLNLGCSDDLRPGYLNVDCEPFGAYPDTAPYQQANLDSPWPWEDSSVEEVFAHDVFEHLLGGKIWAMNEAHRVLCPGGLLDLAVPCVYLADGTVNPGAFADPTHMSFWTLDDRYYFGDEWNNPQGERGRLGTAYGITALFSGRWELREYGTGPERRSKIFAKLRAVK